MRPIWARSVLRTDQVVAQMVKKGWSEEEVLKLKADGYRYSPGRDSLLGPLMSIDDMDDEETEIEIR